MHFAVQLIQGKHIQSDHLFSSKIIDYSDKSTINKQYSGEKQRQLNANSNNHTVRKMTVPDHINILCLV